MRNLLFKPVIFVSILLGLFIIGEFIAIGGLTWHNHQRLNALQSDIRNGHKLEEVIFVLLNNQLQANQRDGAQIQLQNHLLVGHIDNPEIATDIQRLQDAFDKALQGDTNSLLQAINTTRQLFARQTSEEENLLQKIAADSQLELTLSIILPLVTFVIIFIIARYFFKRNILLPLDSLKDFLQMLAAGDRQPIQQQTADPAMQGLFDNYNQLVIRLTELEREHLNYTGELEQEVRRVTSTLLEQSQAIAHSERLSVVAELAASTAHELRNPLAGIQVALENILRDCSDDDLSERVHAVNAEVKRLTSHLNDLLALTRTSSNTATRVDINDLGHELRQFLKYQIPENISLDFIIEPVLTTFLPETEFRLALLNLLLNAQQAIGNNPGQIQLTAQQDKQQIIISVQDSGSGFDQDFLEHGIRPFISLKTKGTGLGLAMVQRFVKSQQGTIKLSNNQGGHACVTLTLPALKS
ncbi:MAG: HAMP domain-containing sensor histidine kinase [Methyloprofundus sp.]|nr:HAMP domain-containing sensor histidine kinase [Methyloprofundus sp.]MDT8426696.1 HAMP domain-containing sensor histidine kinase [Methyloprofundus sp.]